MEYTEKQKLKIEKNIWKYAIFLITNKRATAAILSLYFLSIPNIHAQHIGWIMLAGNAASFLFEIPSGYLSDKMGHKNMLILSKTLLVISSTAFLLANNMWLLMLGSACLAMAFAGSSGTGSAFMHDTLKALGRDDEFAKITGKVAAFGFGVPLIFSASAPFLIEYSYKAPFALSLVLDIIGLWAAISLRRVKHSEEHKQQVKETKFKDVIKEAKDLKYLSIATLSGFLAGALIGFQVYRGPYHEFVGVDVIWLGVFFAAGRVIASTMVAYSGRIKNMFNDIYAFEKFQAIAFSLLFIGFVLTDNMYAVIALFILMNGLQWGLSQVGVHFSMEIIGQSKFKATILSLRGQFKESASAFVALVLGYLISGYCFSYAIIIFTVFFIIMVSLLYLNTLRERDA
tara:strand:- start:3019 stop:4218 length:1200 start_codon:yes stop_codon:yes gene_type:complete